MMIWVYTLFLRSYRFWGLIFFKKKCVVPYLAPLHQVCWLDGKVWPTQHQPLIQNILLTQYWLSAVHLYPGLQYYNNITWGYTTLTLGLFFCIPVTELTTDTSHLTTQENCSVIKEVMKRRREQYRWPNVMIISSNILSWNISAE